jgi:ElaB/YqjD/DUF883 family membrane-anchored ribosome-binding protein
MANVNDARMGGQGQTNSNEDKIMRTLGNVENMMGEQMEKMAEFANEKVAGAKAEIRERPLLYTAIALGAGIAIGYMMKDMHGKACEKQM